MSTRRLSQNQFIGLKVDLPLSYIQGATYLATDTEELFMYNDEELPILIGSGSVGSSGQERAFASTSAVGALAGLTPTESEIKTWNDGLPEPYVDTIIYYTGSETSTDPTIAAFHVDTEGAVTDLSGDEQSVTFPDIFGGNAIIRGGVIHIEDLDFYVWSTGYIIDSVYYEEPVSGTVTLDPSDPTNDRIDLFVVENDGDGTAGVGKVTGTPGASPVKPNLDLQTQAEVSLRIVQATETSPAEITKELIYDEHTGSPSEWDLGASQLADNPVYATDPYKGTVCFRQPSEGTFVYSKASDNTPEKDDSLIFAIKLVSGASISRSQFLSVALTDSSLVGGIVVPTPVTMNNISANKYGLNFYLLDEWQLVQIPLSDFGFLGTYDTITFTSKGTTELNFDWIHIQSGITGGGSGNFPYLIDVEEGSGITIDKTDPQRPIISASSVSPTGLESIDEGNGDAWRLIGREAANYGSIGSGAVDFSYSASASSTKGAVGNLCFAGPGEDLIVEGSTNTAFGAFHTITAGTYSSTNSVFGYGNDIHPWCFAALVGGYLSEIGTSGSTGGSNPVCWHSINWGYDNNLYGGRGTAMFGSGLIHGGAFCTVVGAANVDVTDVNATQSWSPSNTTSNPGFVVGIGNVDSSNPAIPTFTRKNGFIVWRDGTVEMPESSEALITARGNHAVASVEWVNSNFLAALEGYSETGTKAGDDLVINIGDTDAQPFLKYTRSTNKLTWGELTTSNQLGITMNSLNSLWSGFEASGTFNEPGGTGSLSFGVGGISSDFTNDGDYSLAIGRGINIVSPATYSGAIGTIININGTNQFGAGSVVTVEGSNGVGLGTGIDSKAYSEIALGTFNTNGAASSASSYSVNDRAFVIGIGSGSGSRADGLVVQRSGEVTFDSLTNTLIESGPNTVAITKDYLNQRISAFRQESSAYTVLTTDRIIECTTGTFTVDLYTASGNAGRQVTIKNSGAGVITVDAVFSETIDGNLTATLNQYDSLTVVSNGTNWIII